MDGASAVPPKPTPSPRIPPEIVLQILSLVLINPKPLAFTLKRGFPPEQPRRGRRAPPLPLRGRQALPNPLRLCTLNECEHLAAHPPGVALAYDYYNLSLVSHKVRDLSATLFFGENKWVLHGYSKASNRMAWIGSAALARMTDVRIEMQTTGPETYSSWAAEAVQQFVLAAIRGGNLRRLSVQWIYGSPQFYSCPRSRGHAGYCGPHVMPVRSGDGTRLVDGTRTGTLGPPSGWANRQMVLKPLLELHGLLEATVEGTVTEEWAEKLEGCMRGNSIA